LDSKEQLEELIIFILVGGLRERVVRQKIHMNLETMVGNYDGNFRK